jgi:DNA repair photolyase
MHSIDIILRACGHGCRYCAAYAVRSDMKMPEENNDMRKSSYPDLSDHVFHARLTPVVT